MGSAAHCNASSQQHHFELPIRLVQCLEYEYVDAYSDIFFDSFANNKFFSLITALSISDLPLWLLNVNVQH